MPGRGRQQILTFDVEEDAAASSRSHAGAAVSVHRQARAVEAACNYH